ncbi:ISAs1 family transposase [Desulfobacter vibrioformis]|uniref:ISAs1 family transposase n=1 Tax=Desulfobacter vibrioformis TaxID=34031 RepID=UPI000A02441E
MYSPPAVAPRANALKSNTWEQIEHYGNSKHEWLSTFLELPNGIPSHDTIRRVFILIDPNEFRTAFINWIKSIKDLMGNEVVSIDGKTLTLQRYFRIPALSGGNL